MKKIFFLFLFASYSLFADALPKSIKTTIQSLSNDTIKLSNNVPVGMSGIIIHNYGNGLSAITYTTISLGNSQATIKPHTAILHQNIPSIQTAVAIGDHVIFGNFYDNALVIAPNQIAYKQITKKFKRTWIHPDAFALEFMIEGKTKLSMEILEKFAKKNQVGLVLVVSAEELLVIDPISQKIIGSTALKTNPDTAMSPFYARFEQMDFSVFGLSKKDYTPYFQSVAGLK